MLGLAWRLIGHTQYDQVGGPDRRTSPPLGDAVNEWAMGVAFQLMILNSNEPTIVTRWRHPITGTARTSPAHGSSTTTRTPSTASLGSTPPRSTSSPADCPRAIRKASFSVLDRHDRNHGGRPDADQLELGPDCTFVLTVSGARRSPDEKNHLQITPDTTLIAIRDTLSDWNTEDPMSLAIHCTAGPPNSLFSQSGDSPPGIGPLVAQSEILTALVSLIPLLPVVPPIVGSWRAADAAGITEEAKYIKVATTDPVTGERKGPNVFTDPTSNASFLATQLQSAGYFQLSDDEALVLTIRPNNAGYFCRSGDQRLDHHRQLLG